MDPIRRSFSADPDAHFQVQEFPVYVGSLPDAAYLLTNFAVKQWLFREGIFLTICL